MCNSSSIAKAATGIAASVVESSSSFSWNPGMFLYSPVPVLFPPTKKYYANLKQMMIVRQSTHHRTEWRSSQLPPIPRLKEGNQVEKIGPDFSRRSSPQIHANALPRSLPPSFPPSFPPSLCLWRLFSSAMYTCSRWRNTVLGLGVQTLNQYPHNNPGVQRFFFFGRIFATWREEKRKRRCQFPKVQRVFMGKILCPSPQSTREKFKT